MIIAWAKHKTLYCLIFNDGFAGIRANTPESMEDPERHVSPPSEAPERSPKPVQEGRHRATAAVWTMHPPSFLARISASLTQEKTSDIISNVRSHYVVPDGDQAPGVDPMDIELDWNVGLLEYPGLSMRFIHFLQNIIFQRLLLMNCWGCYAM